MHRSKVLAMIVLMGFVVSCSSDTNIPPKEAVGEWSRAVQNPIFRDFIPSENYQVASDPHVFFDENGQLKMVYTGDVNGKTAIKLADGNSWTEWSANTALLDEPNSNGSDSHKETAFYRLTSEGAHQIYYIGYENETSYEAQIFLAEASSLTGEYTQMDEPIIPKGLIAGKDVYCMTSPSVVEHQGLLYMSFIGWDAAPNQVTEVWVMGATSMDEGHTWSDFQLVDSRIGMEGQLTKAQDGSFIGVRTTDYQSAEAIFYATAPHPFGPWQENETPILIQKGPPYEKDEIIAPQVTIDPQTNIQHLFYTGADHQTGWWIMHAEQKP